MDTFFRRATPEDFPTIVDMHAEQGLPYELPPLGDRSILERIIAIGKDGPAYALLLRLTSEAYLIGKPRGTPEERWATIRRGHDIMMNLAIASGVDDVTCSVPPGVDKHFGKRLLSLGWERNRWPHYSIWCAERGVRK